MPESGQKKHPASARKLHKAREEGNVAQSASLSAALSTLVLAVGLGWSLPAVSQALVGGSATVVREAAQSKGLAPGLAASAGMASDVGLSLLPALIGALASAILLAFLQVGPSISAKSLVPKLERLNPVEGLKSRIFSLKGVMELVRNTMTLAAIGVVLGFIAWDELRAIVDLPHAEIGVAAETMAHIALRLLFWGSVSFTAIGTVDLLWQRHHHLSELRMTDQEVRDEHRENEGDPEVRKVRKQRHRQLLQESALAQARKATFLARNPTHIACAVLYEPEHHPLPRVIAKGCDVLALQMVDIARDHGVELVEDIPLARALYRLPVGEPIPNEMLAAVTEVLRQIQERMLSRGEAPPWLAAIRKTWSPREQADFDAHLERIRVRLAEESDGESPRERS